MCMLQWNLLSKDLISDQINKAYLILKSKKRTQCWGEWVPVTVALKTLPASWCLKMKSAWVWYNWAKETRSTFHDTKGILQQKLVVIVQSSKHFPVPTNASAERKDAISVITATTNCQFCYPEKECQPCCTVSTFYALCKYYVFNKKTHM